MIQRVKLGFELPTFCNSLEAHDTVCCSYSFLVSSMAVIDFLVWVHLLLSLTMSGYEKMCFFFFCGDPGSNAIIQSLGCSFYKEKTVKGISHSESNGVFVKILK